ncbi:hypothetical protein EU546_00230 [Candidatus Thorarchaeota archaeon]|nr:MAG: hypothetical protein EU546_00230 [Candidatus Thorarchaeota archaeon]
MKDEEVVASLNEALDYTRVEGEAIIEDLKKLEVALTNVMRLTSVEESTLSKLHGTGDDLRSYLIRLAAEAHRSNERFIDGLSVLIKRTLEMMSQ